jgi:hypothetical protein
MLRGSSSLLSRIARRAPLARAALPLLAAYAPEAFRSRSARGLHIFAKTTASLDEFCKVAVADGADISDLKKAVIAELKLEAAPNRVRLLREVEGGGAPVRLDSRQALAAQGVREGSSVLIEVLPPPPPPLSPAQLAREQQLDRAVAAMSALAAAAAAPPVSASQLGYTLSEALAKLGKVEQELAIPGAAAVLSVAQAEQLRAVSVSELEAGVVAFMTPFLAQYAQEAWEGAAGAAPALVNSEVFPWLLPPAAPHLIALRYKPDLFLTWPPFAELRQAGQRGQGQGEGYLFGRLAGQGALQREGCVSVVFEAKVGSLTRSHFGELASYHQALPGAAWGLLFGPEHFWMYSSYCGLPIALRKDAWAAGGSAARLRCFLAEAAKQPPPPLQRLLRRLLADLRLVPFHLPSAAASAHADPGAQGASCHLGSGASGHVFAARPSAGSTQPLALKAVLAPRKGTQGQPPHSFATVAYSELGKEFQALCALAGRGAPVVPPVPGSLRFYEQRQGGGDDGGDDGGVSGGGYALACVCTPVAVDSLLRCREVFAALAALHAHGTSHGDARLANLMALPEGAPAAAPSGTAQAAAGLRLAWIDVRAALDGGSGSGSLPLLLQHLQRADALTLARSVLRVGAEGEAPARVHEAAQRWEASSAGTVAALAEAVWAAAQ